jgi:uridylate kinase
LKAVFKIGGHLLPVKYDATRIAEYAKTLKKIRRKGHTLAVVVGGGENARSYVDAARSLGADEASCDQIGIEVTRLNAELLIQGLGEDAYPTPPRSIPELKKALQTEKIVVLGGLTPGHSTDAVAAIVSEIMKAELFVRLTDVDGVYTDNPKTNPDAKRIDTISARQLLEMVISKRCWAGEYELIDPIAAKIIERSSIPTRVVDGKDPKNLERVVLQQKKIGTLVSG